MPMRWPFGRRGAKQRVDFQRPDGWHNLDGSPPPQPLPSQPPPPTASQPTMPQAAPPQPAPTPHHAPPPTQPPTQPPAPPPWRNPGTRTTLRQWRPVLMIAIVSAIVLVGGWNVANWLNDRPDTPNPAPPKAPDPVTEPYRRPPGPVEDVPMTWQLNLGTLRPELTDGRFETSISGLMDSEAAVDAGDTWLVVTRETEGGRTQLHGLDADTGEERWTRPMEGVICADDLLDEHLLCAEPTQRERDLGTSWLLHLIDPDTGRSASSVPFDGWINALVVDHEHVVILEQRLPAPHALITGLDGDLTQAWQFDLSQHEGHSGLFSENRVIIRPEEYPEGPALDRPRVRRVADGLTALWVGARTAFLDVPGGRLVGMPHCSRLVDDGSKLWCNAGQRAVAYDYQLNPITRTEDGIRLAFPNRDPRSGDITIPAFLSGDGTLMSVDLTTGATQGPLVRTTMGNAFGTAIPPATATIDGVLLVADNSRTAAVAPDTGEVVWVIEYGLRLHDPFLVRGNLLASDYSSHEVDLATGEILNGWRITHGFGVIPVGEHLASYSLDELARLDLG